MKGKLLRYIPLFTIAIILCAVLFFPWVRMYMHALVNVVIGGRSTMKLFALMVYVGLLFVFVLCKDRIPPQKNTYARFLFLVIGILFIFQFCLGIYFSHTYSIPITDFAILFHNGEISSTTLSHMHEGKGAIGTMLSWFGFTGFQSVDAGHAYIGLVPSYVYGAFMLGIMTAVVLALRVFVAKLKEGVQSPLFFSIAYAIISFSLIERTFDGGFFDERTPIMLAAYVMLVFSFRNIVVRSALCIASLSPLLLVVYTYMGIAGTREDVIVSLWQVVGIALLMTSILFVVYKGTVNRLGLLLLILAGVGIYPAFANFSNHKAYRMLPVEAGTYVGIIGAPQEGMRTIETTGDFSIVEASPVSYRTVADIIDTNDLVASMYPVAVPWKTCFPKGRPSVYSFTLTTKETIASFEEHRFSYAYTITKTDRPAKYHVVFLITPCIPRHLNVIEYALYQVGLTEFVISDIQTQEYGIRQ